MLHTLQVDDVVSRVLGGGVANRWLGRLRPVAKWLEDARKGDLICKQQRASGNAWRRSADGLEGAASREGRFGSVRELDDFFAYAVRRDRERAVVRLSIAGGTLTPDTIEPECDDGAEAGEWVMQT